MNNETTKLLQDLANKLGTTTEYLWKVLLRQAPIDATVTLIQFVIVCLLGVALYKVHIYLSNDIETKSSYKESRYEDLEGIAVIPMVLCGMAWGILFIITFCCLGDVVNGYFNPEYWALNRILNRV